MPNRPANTPVSDQQMTEAAMSGSRLGLSWDTNTAVAALVLGSVLYLWALNRGFMTY